MNLQFLDKLGAIGAFIAALACPICFPLLAVIGSAIGLGVFRPFEGTTMYIFQVLVLIALLGNIISYFNHKKKIPLVIGIASPVLIFFSFYVRFNEVLLYVALFGLLITAVFNYLENRKCKTCRVERGNP